MSYEEDARRQLIERLRGQYGGAVPKRCDRGTVKVCMTHAEKKAWVSNKKKPAIKRAPAKSTKGVPCKRGQTAKRTGCIPAVRKPAKRGKDGMSIAQRNWQNLIAKYRNAGYGAQSMSEASLARQSYKILGKYRI